MSRIADSLDSLAAVHVRDLALAGVKGGTNEVSEAPQSPRAEEAALPVSGAKPVDAEGDFDLIFAGLKSECVLPSCSGEPVVSILIDHGFYPFLSMVYKCFKIYSLLYRVYLE